MNLEVILRELQFKDLPPEVQLRELIANRLEKIKITQKDEQRLLEDFTFSRFYVPFVAIDDNSMEIFHQISHSGNLLISSNELEEKLLKIARMAISQVFKNCCIKDIFVEPLDGEHGTLWTFSFKILIKTSKD